MKKLPVWLIIQLVLFAACDKQVLEEDLPCQTDSTEIVIPIADSTILSVSQSQAAYVSHGDVSARVEGYIVGCVAGTSIGYAQFAAPFGAPSNLLIADLPSEKNTSKCIPVALPANSTFREDWNLVDHPELLYRKVLIKGLLTTYFRQTGINEVQAFTLLHDTETPSDSTAHVEPVDTTSHVSLPIDENGQVILGGRLVKRR